MLDCIFDVCLVDQGVLIIASALAVDSRWVLASSRPFVRDPASRAERRQFRLSQMESGWVSWGLSDLGWKLRWFVWGR